MLKFIKVLDKKIDGGIIFKSVYKTKRGKCMKKFVSVLISAMLLLSVFVFVGCGGNGDYQQVDWSRIETFIQQVEKNATLESDTRVEDGYMRTYSYCDKDIMVLKGYNQDGLQQLLIEYNTLDDNEEEIISTQKQYYVDGYLYEEEAEKEHGVWNVERSKEAMDFEAALFYTYNKDNDVFAGVNLDMWRPYVLMGEDVKIYMLESTEGTKIKVVHKDSSYIQFNLTVTYEYLYTKDYKLVEFNSVEDYGSGEKGITKICKTPEPITFPDLSGFDNVG